jgi:hypothetical protein
MEHGTTDERRRWHLVADSVRYSAGLVVALLVAALAGWVPKSET